METINNKLSDYTSSFFNNLKEYLDTKLYFYGSILRHDYFYGQSDIDVDIFTDNESSIISKMSMFLHIPTRQFDKIIWRSPITNHLIHGYKVMYYDKTDTSLKVEFSIYNEKNKTEVLKVHLSKSKLPFYATSLLWILKILFYYLQLISIENYRFFKSKTLSLIIGIPEIDFIKI